MCAKLDRYTKTKKSSYTSLEVFALRQKDVPIEVLENVHETTVQTLQWEPNGDRFALFATEGAKISFGVFKLDKTGIKELCKFLC